MYLRIGILGVTITASVTLGAETHRWIDNTSGNFELHHPEPEYDEYLPEEEGFGFR